VFRLALWCGSEISGSQIFVSNLPLGFGQSSQIR
jgi:hypothetical protein